MSKFLPGINHIIYLMLENRSLDSVLGYLYESNEPINALPDTSNPVYNGLNTGTYSNPDGHNHNIPVAPIAAAEGQRFPSVDPQEDFDNVQHQIADGMSGFYLNFNEVSKDPVQIMKAFTRDSLPVLNTLAREFAVSDAYFCSVPSNTDANRAFSLTGNSIGTYYKGRDHLDPVFNKAMVNTDVEYWTDLPPFPFTGTSIWDVLSGNGKYDWAIYYSQLWPGLAIDPGSHCYTQLLISGLNGASDYFHPINDLFDILNEQTNKPLPAFSYVEPRWCLDFNIYGKDLPLQMGNDYHPPANLACGEAFLQSLFTSLQASKYWNETLLIINFDEHGGTYDHVTPPGYPENKNLEIRAPWDNPAHGTSSPDSCECDFDFKKLGVRVPLLLISPLIEKNTVIRSKTSIPFDHTSILATILKHFDIDIETWSLGSRTYNADTIEHVFTGISPRTDKITFDTSLITCNPQGATNQEVQDLPLSMMRRGMAATARRAGLPEEHVIDLLNKHFSTPPVMVSEMHEKAKDCLTDIQTRSIAAVNNP